MRLWGFTAACSSVHGGQGAPQTPLRDSQCFQKLKKDPLPVWLSHLEVVHNLFFFSFWMHPESCRGFPNPPGHWAGSSKSPQPHYLASTDGILGIVLLASPYPHFLKVNGQRFCNAPVWKPLVRKEREPLCLSEFFFHSWRLCTCKTLLLVVSIGGKVLNIEISKRFGLSIGWGSGS